MDLDRHTLLKRFRYITLIASLAYTFTVLHTIQYSMQDHDDNNNTTTQIPQDHDSSQATSTYDSPATTGTSMLKTTDFEKNSSQWTEK